jgi:GT2 family glycosyltransferase
VTEAFKTPSVPTTDYCAAIVTFGRPAGLLCVLDGLALQRHRPTVVVVADNDPSCSARATVELFTTRSDVSVDYVAVGRNLGPAGGWAAAVAHAQRRADRGEWVAVFDDDDPVSAPDVMADLVAVAGTMPATVAAVGLRGARLHRRLATLRRVTPPVGASAPVDYLASGGAPLYRWSAIDEVGFFDGDLFFGFEDLELGLRLQRAGYTLMVAPAGDHDVADTAPQRSPWREYFKARALVVIARRHLGAVALVATLTRVAVLGSLLRLVKDRSVALAVARVRGSLDALRGRLGPSSYTPTSNPAKR